MSNEFEMRSDRKRIEADSLYTALSLLVGECTTGDVLKSGEHSGVRSPGKHIVENARNVLAIYADRHK